MQICFLTMYVINTYTFFLNDELQIWASQYNALHEKTKQPLTMAILHLTFLIYYYFVEKSVRNDL